jgi:alkylhydroperoxidase family enzyme
VPDAIWNEADKQFDQTELASLILAIATINVWNRLNVAVRQPAGVWQG